MPQQHDLRAFLKTVASGCKRPLTNGEVVDLIRYNNTDFPVIPPVGNPSAFSLYERFTNAPSS